MTIGYHFLSFERRSGAPVLDWDMIAPLLLLLLLLLLLDAAPCFCGFRMLHVTRQTATELKREHFIMIRTYLIQ